MIHRRSKQFTKLFDRLPKPVQELAKKNFEIFKRDEHHPSLEFKHMADELHNIWSVRVGNSWRALGRERPDGKTIDWFWIGPHEEYNRLTGTTPGRRSIKEDDDLSLLSARALCR